MEQRIAAFADRAARPKLVSDAERRILPLLRAAVVGEVYNQSNREYQGQRLAEIARKQGKSIPDVMLDIAVADDLQTEFQINDVIHADRHGAVVIPPEAIKDLPSAVALLARREKVIIDAAKAPGFSVARLRQAFAEQEEIH